MRSRVVMVALVAALCAQARGQLPSAEQMEKELATIYAARPASPVLEHRGELARELEPILIQQAKFLIGELRPWEKSPNARLLTVGNSNEHSIRPNAHMASGLAMMLRTFPDEALGDLSREQLRDHVIELLEFLLPTHGAGGETTNDDKQWKNQWQSALWAAAAGRAAWLIWDDLTPRQQWLVARMICDEADRFVNREPDHQVERDTKAEENAWNSSVISVAANMFPNHPRSAVYRETTIRWFLSAFATSRDVTRTDVIDGRPLNQWIQHPNLYDDYTLENHNRVHPDYMNTIRNNAQHELYARWAGNAVPQALYFNADKVYASLKKMTLPDAGFVYPNAQDWHLRRNADWLDTHVMMAISHEDAQAARLVRIGLETAQRMIGRSSDGGIYAPGETVFPSSQQMLLDLYAKAYLLLRADGEGPEPVDEQQLWRDLAGTHVFTYGKFAVVRTAHSVSTFSWGRQIMGLVFPMRNDLLVAPNERGLIGIVRASDIKRETPVVSRIEVMEDGIAGVSFAVAGVLERAGGAMTQPFAFVVLDDGRTIYVDAARAMEPEKLTSVNLGTIGILNDKNWIHHTGRRTLYHADGEVTFHAQSAETDSAVELSSPWVNVDGMGIVVLSSGGQMYDPKPTTARGRLEQLFHLNQVRDVNEIRPTALVFYPSQDAAVTRAVAGRVLLVQTGAQQFIIKLEDGTKLEVDLEKLTVTSTG